MFGLTHKLALSNLLKNRRLYYPFALMSVVSTAIFYIFRSLMANPNLDEVWGAGGIARVLGLGLVIITVTIILMILYANAFVMKQRSKEFGLYSMLGLEKKHLLYMNAVETLLFSTVTVSLGVGLGALLDKLFYALLLKAMRVHVVLVSTFQWQTVFITFASLMGIFLLVSLFNAGRLGLRSSMILLKDKQKGEKKGRFLWLQTILGLVLLGLAYYMSQTVVAPIKSMWIFFQAVVLVILATYLLFNAGIISLLRFLQERPSYYYKPSNFISVSNLVFRMRKNAMGLATISILSTMFLVTLVGGVNIFLGGQDLIEQEAPNDFLIIASNGRDEKGQLMGSQDKVLAYMQGVMEEAGIPVTETTQYTYRFGLLSQLTGNQMTTASMEDIPGIKEEEAYVIGVFSEEDYQKMTGKALSLKEGQVAVYAKNHQLDSSQPLVVNGQDWQIGAVLTDNFLEKNVPIMLSRLATKELYLVAKDETQFLDPIDEQYYLGFETSLSEKAQLEKSSDFMELATGIRIREQGQDTGRLPFGAVTTSSRAQFKDTYFFLAGTLFFIGIFLALVFIMATVLVIYYKQISEGYEDRGRFVTLQQVGLDESQAKSSIGKQVLTVFFLPVIVAVTHLGFAYKMLVLILRVMGLVNQTLILQVTLGVCGVYLLIYLLVYAVTSRSYHQIVKS